MAQEKWYKLPQAAADAVEADGVPRIVQGVDQDGQTQDHVMWRNPRGAVQSTLASAWVGPPLLMKIIRWEAT